MLPPIIIDQILNYRTIFKQYIDLDLGQNTRKLVKKDIKVLTIEGVVIRDIHCIFQLPKLERLFVKSCDMDIILLKNRCPEGKLFNLLFKVAYPYTYESAQITIGPDQTFTIELTTPNF